MGKNDPLPPLTARRSSLDISAISKVGLIMCRIGFHSPGDGRFLTPDPSESSAGLEAPLSWNRYSYVSGDPVNYVDPWELQQNCGREPNGEPKKCPPPPPPSPPPYRPPVPPIDGDPCLLHGPNSVECKGESPPATCPTGYVLLVSGECEDEEAYFNRSAGDSLLNLANKCLGEAIASQFGLNVATGIMGVLTTPKAAVPPFQKAPSYASQYTSLLSSLGHYVEINIPKTLGTTNLLRANFEFGCEEIRNDRS